MEIAVYDAENNKIVWEKITEIRTYEPQHVYDLVKIFILKKID